MSLLTGLVLACNFENAANLGQDGPGVNNLTNVGGATQAAGKIGQAVSLDGATQWLSHADNADFSLANTSWTFTAWVNATALGAVNFHTVFGKFNSAGGAGAYEYGCFWNPVAQVLEAIASVDGTVGTLATVLSPYSTFVGTWSFVEVSFDFVNGLLAITQENQAPNTVALTNTFDGTNLFEVGENVGGAPWAGLIDSANLWKRLLTAPEKAQLFAAGPDAQYPFSLTSVRRNTAPVLIF
jgi:hypothetical protein